MTSATTKCILFGCTQISLLAMYYLCLLSFVDNCKIQHSDENGFQDQRKHNCKQFDSTVRKWSLGADWQGSVKQITDIPITVFWFIQFVIVFTPLLRSFIIIIRYAFVLQYRLLSRLDFLVCLILMHILNNSRLILIIQSDSCI